MFKRLIYRNYRAYTGVTFRFGRRISPAGWILLGGMFISAALGLDTTQTLAYQTFSFLFACLLVAVLGSAFSRPKVRFERVLPKFATAGEPLRYQILATNLQARPQRDLSIIEHLPDPRPSFQEFLTISEPGEEKRNWYDRSQGWYRWEYLVSKNRQAIASETAMPELPVRRQMEVNLELIPTKRGVLQLQGLILFAPDPLGIFRTLRVSNLPQSLLVLPKRYQVGRIEFSGATKFQRGDVSVGNAIGESEEFVSLRDYRAGDPLRHIHWRSYAKLGRPVVKEFQDEFFVRHALVLDTFGVPLHSELFEEAVSVAASYAYTMETSDTMLDLMFVGPQAYCFTGGRSGGQTEQMLEILAAVQPCREKQFSSLKQIVREHLDTVSGCLCVFVSWDNERQSFVEELKALRVPVMVLVITETDTELSPGAMADKPEYFRQLPLGKVGEELAKL